jgi:hypothetical protein
MPVLYARPYPLLFSMIIFAPRFFAISCVLSFEIPSIIAISSSQFFFLKISFFMESMVF